MSNIDLEVFLRALCEINLRSPEPAGSVMVRVFGDDFVYKQWAPIRQADIKSDGLLDPGLGSGPIDYSDIGQVSVHKMDWIEEKGAAGEQDYIDLLEMISGRANLMVSDRAVTWQG